MFGWNPCQVPSTAGFFAMPSKTYRHTKIIITIGPATSEEAVLTRIIQAGADVVRFNMAHANHDWTTRMIGRVRQACFSVQRQMAFLMDVKGPEIRTGDLPAPWLLEKDELFDFYTEAEAALEAPDVRGVTVNYPGLVLDLHVGATVLVDSGLIKMEVVEKTSRRVRCRVLIPGRLTNRRHINLPGIKTSLPALTRKDIQDIELGVRCGVDLYALSFVREAEDIEILRRQLRKLGSTAGIIAKIEDQSAVDNLHEIVTAADGLMIARGDLGIEVPFERLPRIQREAVRACLVAGKVSIVATQMLESMTANPLPTRAEITDVANAVLEQADAVMLSGETSVGQYPVECVSVLNRIILEMEQEAGAASNTLFRPKTSQGKILLSAVALAAEMPGAAIVVFTRKGVLARKLSALRPRHAPVFAFTFDCHVFQKMLIQWGIEPFFMEFPDDMEETIAKAIAMLVEKGWVQSGQPLVLISTSTVGVKLIDTLQIRWVD